MSKEMLLKDPLQFELDQDWFLPGHGLATEETSITGEGRLLILIFNSGKTGKKGTAYAWGKTARLICEPHYNQALQNTDGNFVALDLCSSLPIWPQIIRERYRDECYTQATKIVGEAIVALQQGRLPSLPQMKQEERRNVIETVSPKRSSARRLLHAPVLKFLYNPPIIDKDESDGTNLARLSEFFKSRFKTSIYWFGKVFEREELVGRGRWEIITQFQPPLRIRGAAGTLEEELATLVKPDKIDQIIDSFALFLAKKCLANLRRHTIISLDLEEPQKILDNAENSFPQSFQETMFFVRACDMGTRHIQADTLRLPLAPNSVSFISSIEGYPYYFSKLPFQRRRKERIGDKLAEPKDHLSFACQIAQILKPGGTAVFFPWHTKNKPKGHGSDLENVERYWEKQGLKITKIEHNGYELRKQMGDRESTLTLHSPVFKVKPGSSVTVLVLEKPQA